MKQMQHSDVDKVSLHDYGDMPTTGDGQGDNMQHSDADGISGYSKNFLKSCNVIDGSDIPQAQTIWVDNSRADRGKDA